MVALAAHLPIEELRERFRSASDPVEKSHVQTVFLLAKGYEVAAVAEIVALTPRWVRTIVARYNTEGPQALGDRRQHNTGGTALLSADDLAALRERLATPPDDGGVWTSAKVAAWMAARLGVPAVHVQRGWEALKRLGFSIQTPRPRHPQAATPQDQDAFKKNLPTRPPKKPPSIPTSRSKCSLPTSTGSA